MVSTHRKKAEMKEFIERVCEGVELDSSDVSEIVGILVDENADEVEKADFLEALAARGETAGEIASFVSELLDRSVDPGVEQRSLCAPAIDVCGTGGDKIGRSGLRRDKSWNRLNWTTLDIRRCWMDGFGQCWMVLDGDGCMV